MAISTIKLITDSTEINQLQDFIKRFPLDYPNYDGWVKQCYEELCSGSKRAFVCKLEGIIIGSLIFQTHKKEPRILEVKNARVEPAYKRRKIMSRLLKEVEEFARDNGGYNRLSVDTHVTNIPVIKTFQNLGFKVVGKEELYDSRKEIILAKDLT